LPPAWNWLADEYGYNAAAKLVHWTAGIPGFNAYRDSPHADEWRATMLRAMRGLQTHVDRRGKQAHGFGKVTMQIGRLRHRVAVQRLLPGSPEQDAGGVPDEQWTTLFTVLGGSRAAARAGIAHRAADQFRGHRHDPHPLSLRLHDHQQGPLLFDGRTYDIIAIVDPMERNRELILYVREGTNDG
jgi:hypothetical protein